MPQMLILLLIRRPMTDDPEFMSINKKNSESDVDDNININKKKITPMTLMILILIRRPMTQMMMI